MSLKDEILKIEKSKQICKKSTDEEVRESSEKLCRWVERRLKNSNVREIYKEDRGTYKATGRKAVAELFGVYIYCNSSRNGVSLSDENYFSISGENYRQILSYLKRYCIQNDLLIFNSLGSVKKDVVYTTHGVRDRLYVKSRAISDADFTLTTENDVCHGKIVGATTHGRFYLVLEL